LHVPDVAMRRDESLNDMSAGAEACVASLESSAVSSMSGLEPLDADLKKADVVTCQRRSDRGRNLRGSVKVPLPCAANGNIIQKYGPFHLTNFSSVRLRDLEPEMIPRTAGDPFDR
jgi:hypothetical protein